MQATTASYDNTQVWKAALKKHISCYFSEFISVKIGVDSFAWIENSIWTKEF